MMSLIQQQQLQRIKGLEQELADVYQQLREKEAQPDKTAVAFVEKHLALVEEENKKLWKRRLVTLLQENLTTANDDEKGLEAQGIYIDGIEEAAMHIVNDFLLPAWKGAPSNVEEVEEKDCPVCGWSFDSADHAQNCPNYLNEGNQKAPSSEIGEKTAEGLPLAILVQSQIHDFLQYHKIEEPVFDVREVRDLADKIIDTVKAQSL